jgi:hypothetical protein
LIILIKHASFSQLELHICTSIHLYVSIILPNAGKDVDVIRFRFLVT